MKKIVSLLLVLVMCLPLCACGKSEAVKNVEAMIDALGEITLESIDAIRSAEDAYNALTEDEQKKVKNYETLTAARDAYYELAMVGEWCVHNISLYDIESMYSRLNLRLNADMTAVDYGDGGMEISGPWSVTDGRLTVGEVGKVWTDYVVVEEDGKLFLQTDNSNWSLMKIADFHNLLDNMFLIVDLAEVDVGEYCDLYIHKYESKDVWGTPSGISEDVMIGSKSYQNGWCFLYGKDPVIEVLVPQFEEIRTYADRVEHYNVEATTLLSNYGDPFSGSTMQIGITVYNEYTIQSTLAVDQLSFGRAKGVLYFVNLEYVAEITCDVDNCSRKITLVDNLGELNGLWIESYWDEEHPY